MNNSLNDISSNINSLINSFVRPTEGVITSLPLRANKGLEDMERFSNPAPNIIEWIVRPEYLNFVIEDEDTDETRTIYNHYGQYQTIRDFFELLCPICSKPEDKDCWGKSRESLESQPLLVWNKLYKDDECPKCKTTRQELVQSGLFQGFNAMLLIVGMRASKSFTAALIASFIEHKVLTCKSPQKFFGQAPNQLFEISFVATTAKQTEKTVFEAYKGLRENSPWIQSYVKQLKALEKYKGELYKDSAETSIKYNHINVHFESMNSNSSGIAGGTRIASFIDELCRFDTSESKRSAKEIYRVFNQGLKTIRSVKQRKLVPNCFGILVSTSSPISANDFGMTLGSKAPGLKNMFFVHKKTWEFNPYEPIENFEEDFKLDPIGAERDFGARPPLAESPLVLDPDRFKQCIDYSLLATTTFIDVYPKDPTGKEYVGKVIEFCKIDTKTDKVIFGDAGKNRDSFAMACAHGELINNVWTTVFDWVLTVKPTQSPRRIVSFDCAVEIIKKVSEKQKIKVVRFDNWNSESIIQTCSFKGINSDTYSVNSDNYLEFVQDAYEGKIRLLPQKDTDIGKDPYRDMSDAGRAIHELLRLERSMDLKKVDHKVGEHNDIAVCVVGCHYLIQSASEKTTGMIRPLSMGEQHMVGSVGKFRRW